MTNIQRTPPRRSLRAITTAATVAAILVSMAACSPPTETSSSGDNSDSVALTPVGMAIGSGAVISAQLAWGTSAPLGGGYWEEEGLDVKITPVSGSANAFQALAKGDVDFVQAGASTGMLFVNQNAPIVSVASFYDTNTYYPATLADSDIKTVEDFAGARVGIPNDAASQAMWLEGLLDSHGMSTADLASVVSVGDGTDALVALTTGKIDVLYQFHGYYETMEATTDVEFRRFGDDEFFQNTNFGYSLWTNFETLENQPETVEKFIRGLAKGALLTLENPEHVAALHFELYPDSRPDGDEETVMTESAEAMLQNARGTESLVRSNKFGDVKLDVIQLIGELLVSSGSLDDIKDDMSVYFDGQFIAAANDYDVEKVAEEARSR